MSSGTNFVDMQRAETNEKLEEFQSRLELLEMKIETLPGIVAEVLIDSLEELSQYDWVLSGVPVDEVGTPLRDSYGGPAKPTVQVDPKEMINELCQTMESELRKKINFEEVTRLRERVRQLEEDMGYRKKVADRLREEPRGNRRS